MKRLVVALLLLCAGSAAFAEVRLASIFTDHLVLQRQQPIHVWGWGRPGEAVQVTLHAQSARATADAQGSWRAVLKAEAAGGPYTLEVKGDNTVRLRDVLVGEVWLGSGQSNMEWIVANSNDAAVEVAQSDLPRIRHFKVAKTVAFQPAEDIGKSGWKVASPANTGEFSAAAYFFARKLHRELGVPVGIINASWGGSNIETWLSAEALASGEIFDMATMPRDVAAYQAGYRERMRTLVERWQPGATLDVDSSPGWKDPQLDDRAWATLLAPQPWEEQGLADFDGVIWYRRAIELSAEQAAAAATLHLGSIDDYDETYVNGQLVGGTRQWDAPRDYALAAGMLKPGRNLIAVRVTDTGGNGGFHGEAKRMVLETAAGSIALAGPWKARVESFPAKDMPAPNDLPTLLFNSMVRPLTDFPLRGVLWYQGESNVPRAQQYTQAFPLLISDWRRHWRQERLPFYFVQLASFVPVEKNSLDGSAWAELRDAQRQALKLPGTGMAVATDVGDANDIHPRNKQAIGERLALHALKNQYGKQDTVTDGPIYRGMRVRGRQVELGFAALGGGLVAAGKDGKLLGFSIADGSRRFLPAQARIRGNKVIVSHPDIRQPRAVRYGWVTNPEQGNLFNRAGLPASPFRTDDWPWLTTNAKYR